MILGTTTFKCDNCGERFKGVAAEWNATAYIAPVRCPKCGSMHTYPANLGGVFGPPPTYMTIWNIIKNWIKR